MARRRVCLLLAGMAMASILAAGCSQTDDILTPIGSTTLTLNPERLPTTPKGMIYEMWVSTATDSISLGKFYYNFDSLKFYEPTDGSTLTERSNRFALPDDLLRYGSDGRRVYKRLLVSVETYPNDPSADPGPIMLTDEITDPGDNPLQLVFPLSDSLWGTIVRMNMEGVSDRDPLAGDGSGIWFSSYRMIQVEMKDTVDLFLDTVVVQIDTLEPGAKERYYTCRIYNIHTETTLVSFGPDTVFFGDTLRKIAIRYATDSCLPAPPYTKMTFNHTYVDESRLIDLHLFNQDDYGLPDLSHIGWHYKGWVVSNQVPTTAIGELTPPAWPYKSMQGAKIPGWDGGLLTTGTFNRIDQPDLDGNPFALPTLNPFYSHVPPFPGEDFLDGNAMSDELGISSLDLVPLDGSGRGTVFIALEPSNYTSDSTNFPLFLMVMPVPTNPHGIRAPEVQLTMNNESRSVRTDLYGFPQINVTIERF